MSELPTQVLYWVPRYCFGDRLRHTHTDKYVMVRNFTHETFYTIDKVAIVPVYTVYVLEDEREAFVSEDELAPRYADQSRSTGMAGSVRNL